QRIDRSAVMARALRTRELDAQRNRAAFERIVTQPARDGVRMARQRLCDHVALAHIALERVLFAIAFGFARRLDRTLIMTLRERDPGLRTLADQGAQLALVGARERAD